MSWFLLALVGPLLYALTNHIDKLLLEKYFKEGGVGTLLLFSSLLSILAIPVLYIVDPSVLSVDKGHVLVLGVVALLNIGILWFYLLALKEEEASVTIVYYQLVPVFGAILGYWVLGESLTETQLTAMAIIIAGTSVISVEIDVENQLKFRLRTAFYMIMASLCWASGSVIFKVVALEENVWRSLFWEHVVLVILGAIIYAFIPSYRNHFIRALRTNSKAIISLNVANEGIFIIGNVVVAYAYLLAPIALVLLAESFQPIFVLIIGLFLTIFFPTISQEKIEAKHLLQKALAIGLTGFGTFILFI